MYKNLSKTPIAFRIFLLITLLIYMAVLVATLGWVVLGNAVLVTCGIVTLTGLAGFGWNVGRYEADRWNYGDDDSDPAGDEDITDKQ